jgi:cyclic beta-1,2-glucan synthetase
LTSFIRRIFRQARVVSPWDSREAVREELFSLERLEEHARSLAEAQPVTANPAKGYALADRLADNEEVLLKAHRTIAKAIEAKHTITPAAEWLIDNFHIVEKQIRQIRSDLPAGYYRQLPKLAGGPFAGYPRVFGVAWAFVAHTDSRFDLEAFYRYARAYQDVQPLTIGELWALAITLRIVLVENLRRLADGIVRSRAARSKADIVADRLLGAGGHEAESPGLVLADHEGTLLPRAFAVQLLHRLRDQDSTITPALVWLDQKLSAQETTAEEVVRAEHQRQGAASVTMRNIITSMRLISDVDWSELFERISLVEEVFSGSASSYREMDFPTRNLYRAAIEYLARNSPHSELEVARKAVSEAHNARSHHEDSAENRGADLGYHLIGKGRRAFETVIGFRPALRAWPARFKWGLSEYTGSIAILSSALLAIPLIYLSRAGLPVEWLMIFGVAGVLPATDVAVAISNYFVTRCFGARLLPALELRDGVPQHLRTLVVVPTLLSTPDAIEEQIERLEIHHVASLEGDLHFALLSDWLDSDTETQGDDAALLAVASAGIDRLNKRHGSAPGGARFLLLHRRRVWNEGEQQWIGWERKRGKLQELNRLLRGATGTTFVDDEWGPNRLPVNVRYVVTLDADTRLPRDTVRRLIGKMAHPLNRPRFDAATGRVVEGYGVLQPRVTPSLPVGREGSLFQRVFSSSSGIDPYASAVSDVYQDLFGEGSYTGKGIYDVDAFEAAVAGRVPDSTLLSHDLFEGVFARAGLASDVEVVEEFPARYDAAALRHHRWARGDWQLLPWIVGYAPAATGMTRSQRALPMVGRWKMLDNLRRTLSPPSAVAALLVAWSLPLPAALIATTFVLATIVLPICIPIIGAVVPRQPGIEMRSHLRSLGGEVGVAARLAAMQITLLAHQAWLMLDAIGRTLIRLFVTRLHLLEWLTAAQASSGPHPDVRAFYRLMFSGVVIGVSGLAVALLAGSATWLLALPFAVLWIASPAIAQWVSCSPAAGGHLQVLDADAKALRLVARRTWRFFETFVTQRDNMLPPDNFQEDPTPVIAHRTSPTNIGLYLLAVVSARDFGWIGTLDTLGRLEATLSTMGTMARFRGHFYNWYDTQDLRPLEPQYISSVDSGNLAGHLIALANAAREARNLTLEDGMRLSGVADALELTRVEALKLRDGPRTQTVTMRHLDDAISALAGRLAENGTDGGGVERWWDECAAQAETMTDIAGAIAQERGDDAGGDLQFWARACQKTIESHRRDLNLRSESSLTDMAERLQAIEDTARAMALSMDFGFLFDRDRHLLSIGYLVSEGRLDQSCYDLLASEARLASFVAIAKGDIPSRHWFRLGRGVTAIAHGAALISWSGSMFEYLMPSLVMRAPAGSLIEQTTRLIVQRQIAYGARLGVWGISESAYNARDLEFTYQYSNFGVPGLGLKRGLGDNAVIAPYATALAAMVDPHAAVRNFERLTVAGARGRYGFYEAIDYTPIRVPKGKEVALVRAYMAHHQGMSIVAIANALLGSQMRSRFHAETMIQATDLLLQERTPRDIAVTRPWAAETKSAVKVGDIAAPGGRRLGTAHGGTPATYLFSNGRYAVMLTAAGSGYSRWRNISVTRWREDATCDDWGSYVFVRDVRSGEVWSAGFQPSGAEPDTYHVTFNEDRAEISRRDGTITTTMEVLVSTEDDAEVRRVSISNVGSWAREVEVTSYAELALAPPAADAAHPAFSKLFVETEYLDSVGALLATRRRRSPAEPEIWAGHLAVVEGDTKVRSEFETDRARFLGRGCGIRRPIAVIDGQPLSNTVGTVLDPIFALRRRIRIEPGSVVRVAFWTMMASSRPALVDLIDTHRDATAFDRAATLAWTQAQVQLRHLDIDPGEADLFQRLAGHLLYASPTLRPISDAIRRGGGGQPGLWSLSISGDLPILLLRIADTENLDLARQLLRAHEYWRMKQLAVDLVILNERASSYVQDLQIGLESLVRTNESRGPAGGESSHGRVFVVRADLISEETRALLASVARVVLVGQRGRLADQLDRAPAGKVFVRPAPSSTIAVPTSKVAPTRGELEFFNGLGGFADRGREYVTILGPGQCTPAPWVNVVANAGFGFQVATEGSGYTWSANSRENQLTPWSNDPVSDRPGEAFYLRDEDTGGVWTPTAQPIRDDAATYVARHGRGYSRFEHSANDIEVDLLQFVPIDDPVKISRLNLRNLSSRTRNLSITAYAEWVLGSARATAAPFVTTEIDPETGALFARNPWNPDFSSRVAFADLDGRQITWTGDRREFIGRNGTLSRPAALANAALLSNTVGAGLDPCAALRTNIILPPNGSAEVVFFLGQGASTEDARRLVLHYRSADLGAVRARVDQFWNDVLGAVQVKTPDRSMDIMLNGWLLYQTLACRIWARSAFYQASGAYGFRDQLQDGTALTHTRPDLVREHLLRAASRQFVEGDVQHWWRADSGHGVRTRISDGRVWLAYAVSHYVSATGNGAILDEIVHFLEGQRLQEGQHDSFFQPTIADESATLFEHCARALDQSLELGTHGLPLIGTGDWNDGMNRVGEGGQGESVWLGWLLYLTLSAFAPIAKARHELARAASWQAHAAALQGSLEREAWDGEWYRRGYFDDGTPLGSASGEECRIDSIAQSWAAISGGGNPERGRRAMAAVERELILPKDRLALLFAPPFEKTLLDPGYIKGYPPGIRENGGQYTHAALWAVMAFGAFGEGDKAAKLFALLNPINYTATRSDVHRYKVEPYVVAADVYSKPPHVGRGGWTWYTGSAAWMQRAGIESILGLRLEGASLHIEPCIPQGWKKYEMTLCFRSARYEILVENPDGVTRGVVSANLDGAEIALKPLRVPLTDDGCTHHLKVRLGHLA